MKTHSPALAAVIISLFLGACSTTVVQRQEIPDSIRLNLSLKDVKSKLASSVIAPSDTNLRLERAVLNAATGKGINGKAPAKLSITVTSYSIVSGGARFFAGAFAGSNTISAAVEVLDAQTGGIIGQFDVQRDANPGGYGVFFDQDQATIDSLAEGIVAALFGT
jgi:hypothetical protein